MNTYSHVRFRHLTAGGGLHGLGAAADTVVSLTSSTAGALTPVIVGTTAQTLTPVGTTVGAILGTTAPSIIIPVVGVAIAAISIAIEFLMHTGCGQTCIVTSQWANQAEGQLKQNISQWFAITPPRPMSVQKIAMANFQAIWNRLVQLCSQPGLGTAGQNCISDRQDNACKWKAQPPQYPGEPAAGACWNWWNAYYYPIANDPNVYDDSAVAAASTTAAGTSAGAAVSSMTSDPLLMLALVGGALLVVTLL